MSVQVCVNLLCRSASLMYSCLSHNTVHDPLSAGLMIHFVCDLRSLIVFLSADERLCRVFFGVILYRSMRRLRMRFASESLSAETRHVHDEMNGLLIFWYASSSLFVREDCLSLNHIWLVILFSIVSTSDVHMWWSQAFGVGINLSPLSKSCSQVSGAFDSPIINKFSILPPRLSIFVILILRLSPSSQIVFLARSV